MIKVRLTVSTGEHVAYVWMPGFEPLPDVVIWGTRTFQLLQVERQPGQLPAYQEVFAYSVPPGYDSIDHTNVPRELL